MSWIDYWNGAPTLYVSARHQHAHDLGIAKSVAVFITRPNARVLDFGCGDATSAAHVARHCGRLYLWDGAEAVRARLSDRFAANKNITVLSREAFGALESGSIDLVTVVSVIQYLDEPMLSDTLREIRRILSPDGKLLVADVIPPDVGITQDALQLVQFGVREGFAFSAVAGLVRTATSSYLKMRSSLSLRKFTATQFLSLLAAHGFAGRQLDVNIGHNQKRKAYLAYRLPEQATATQEAPHETAVKVA